jgi:hypothetical protein
MNGEFFLTMFTRNSKFDLLRSHWSNADKLWFANVQIKRKKMLVSFCYFAKGIDKEVISVYPSKECDFDVKVQIPDGLIFMDTSRIIQYLVLELAP